MYMPGLFGENLFDEFFNSFACPVRPARHARGCNKPVSRVMKTDVKENDSAYELAIELPGYNKDNVRAELKDGFLTISASREENHDEQDDNGRFIRRERFTGSCSRSFYVGENVTEDSINARFEDGVLKVCVPKPENNPELEQSHFIAIEG